VNAFGVEMETVPDEIGLITLKEKAEDKMSISWDKVGSVSTTNYEVYV